MRYLTLLILLMKALPGPFEARGRDQHLPAQSTSMPAKDARPDGGILAPAGTPAPRLRARQTDVYGPETCGFYNVPGHSREFICVITKLDGKRYH